MTAKEYAKSNCRSCRDNAFLPCICSNLEMAFTAGQTQPLPGYTKEQMGEALKKAVEVIKQWHGEEVFDIYYNHAPEMKPIREAISQLPPAKDAGWLTTPIVNLINSGKSLTLDPEENDPHIISWIKGTINLLETAISTYNNP